MEQSLTFEDKILTITVPKEVPVAQKRPLIYVLDGNAFGPLLTNAILLQARNSPKTGVWPAIIVSIGYQTDDSFQRAGRFRDYTPRRVHPVRQDKRRHMPLGGGIEAFQAQLVRIHALMMQQYQIDEAQVGLFGHSLGGLCVLESYLVSPKLPFITDFLSISPSLWWDDCAFFDRLTQTDLATSKRIFIAVENDQGEMESAAMRCYQTLLQIIPTEQVAFYVGPGENHMSIVFTALSRILRWFFDKGAMPYV